jgi:16S rRNA (uracil1498-N3)-methyltransferase
MTSGLHRFFVDPGLLGGEQIALTGEQAHQISRVLRLKSGDRIVLADGVGHDVTVRLDEVRSSAVVGTVEAIQPSRPEPGLFLTLYQALVPRDRFETVLQKGTEVGISRFVPTWCERSIVPGGDRIDEKRRERWRRIVTEAAEQCERGRVPEIAPPLRFPDALRDAGITPKIVAWERETERSVRAGLQAMLGDARPPRPSPPLPLGEGRGTKSGFEKALEGSSSKPSLAIFIGPEGGFSPAEVTLAREFGALTVSLGPRILRTETAGPILAALALYEAGDLEPPASSVPEAPPLPLAGDGAVGRPEGRGPLVGDGG